MSGDAELWHLVEAKRDDGLPTLFRIRELDPNRDLDRIFVIELPYPTTEALARLPNATSYRRLADLEETWLRPACSSLGCEYVGCKTEDGSFFLYLYGRCDLGDLIAKVSPFDGGLGFYDDLDPEWLEYGTLRDLLDQARAIRANPTATPAAKPTKSKKAAAKPTTSRKAAAKPKARKPTTKKPAKRARATT